MANRSGPSAPIHCLRDRASASSHADHADHVETACDRAGVVPSNRAIRRLTQRRCQSASPCGGSLTRAIPGVLLEAGLPPLLSVIDSQARSVRFSSCVLDSAHS